MADLTGYTAYLTSSELEHAGPILSALLGRVIEESVHFRLVDWRPFRYFSAVEQDPLGSGLVYNETWEIEPGEGASVVRFVVAQPMEKDGTLDGLQAYWRDST